MMQHSHSELMRLVWLLAAGMAVFVVGRIIGSGKF